MKTLNIRLSKDDEVAVRRLKQSGQNVSAIVRGALHASAKATSNSKPTPRSRVEVENMFAELEKIGKRFPDFENGAPKFNVRDRKQLKAAMLERQLQKYKSNVKHK